LGIAAPRFFEGFEQREIMPPVESYVKDRNLVIRADVPGLDPRDIEISVLHDVLTIRVNAKPRRRSRRRIISAARSPTVRSNGV
jgi:HSP20 family molecular chaperone IbpA